MTEWTDTDRLDWLVENECYVVQTPRGYSVRNGFDGDYFEWSSGHETARAAIDDAANAKDESR